jgi:signal transduction histidine kinase
VIAAFNRMQERVRRYLVERGRLLGAISHDLKTPITRLRLRAEMLPDPDVRARMLRDLDEMQTMVGETLNFFSSVGRDTDRQPVDVGALIESVCEDRREAGQALTVRGVPLAPYRADPQGAAPLPGQLDRERHPLWWLRQYPDRRYRGAPAHRDP